MSGRQPRKRPYVLALLVVGMLFIGCEDKRRHKPSEQVSFGAVEPPATPQAAPAELAATFLDALKRFQGIRHTGFGDPGNQRRYDEAMGVMCALTDQAYLHEQVRARGGRTVPKDVTESAAVRLVVESWVSTVAHYIDGFLLETLRSRINSDGNLATVWLMVENPRERKMLEEIEALPEFADPKNEQGDPGGKSSGEYLERLRSKTIPLGFNVPIRRQLTMELKKGAGGWSVRRLDLDGGSMPVRNSGLTRPTTVPSSP